MSAAEHWKTRSENAEREADKLRAERDTLSRDLEQTREDQRRTFETASAKVVELRAFLDAAQSDFDTLKAAHDKVRAELRQAQADGAALRAVAKSHGEHGMGRHNDCFRDLYTAILSAHPGSALLEDVGVAHEALNDLVTIVALEANERHSISGRLGARLTDARAALSRLSKWQPEKSGT